jgi:hypothetical protein
LDKRHISATEDDDHRIWTERSYRLGRWHRICGASEDLETAPGEIAGVFESAVQNCFIRIGLVQGVDSEGLAVS